MSEDYALDEHVAAHRRALRAFSDTSQVRSALVERELNVGTLAALIVSSESAVSHHLRSLRQAGAGPTRREGKRSTTMDDEHIITLFRQGVSHVRQG